MPAMPSNLQAALYYENMPNDFVRWFSESGGAVQFPTSLLKETYAAHADE